MTMPTASAEQPDFSLVVGAPCFRRMPPEELVTRLLKIAY